MKLKSYPEYKDSGIKWIGKIPEEWAVHRIKSFVPYIKNGQWGDDSSGGNNDFIVLRVADFLEFNFNLDKELTITNINDTKLRLKEGDLVIEKSGGGEKQIVGRVVQLKNSSKDKKYTYSNFIGKLDISNRMNKTFLNYYFKAFYNNRVNFNYIKQTTGIQNLDSTSLIQREYFAYPTDKNYQKSIVSFLDKKIAEIDELIEKDKKLIELLKEKRTALINHAVTKGLDMNVKLKDSGTPRIGKIPEGWEVRKIKNNSYVKGRIGWHGLTSEEYSDEGAYLVTGTDFKNGYIEWENCYHVNWERYKEDPYIHLKKEDVLITKDGTIGKVAFIKELPDKATLNSGLFVVRPLNQKYKPKFMYWILNSLVFERFFDFVKQGATISHLFQETFERFFFPIPPLPEQTAIANFLDNVSTKIDKTIQKIQKKIELLEEYKKSLIHHTVTGKIDVRGSEI